VWPHDTALAVAGLSRYGHDHEASSLSLGLLQASSATAGRLPELFAGFDRSDLAAPVPYPTSCSPQAWAAASPLLLVRAMLGLEPDLLRGRVLLRPRLPEGMDRLRIESMSLGSDRVDIDIDGDGVNVTGLSPGIELAIE
jgi:glycogen debranching enzyme